MHVGEVTIAAATGSMRASEKGLGVPPSPTFPQHALAAGGTQVVGGGDC